ncbi:hypothetical protein [Porphyromonas endodontalis]
MDIKQFEFGVQKKAYADHVYKWYVTPETDEEKETLLEYCRKNLKNAPRSKEEYFRDKRQAKGLDEVMGIVSGGYYELRKLDYVYIYSVTREYID